MALARVAEARSEADQARLREVAGRAKPVALAGERLLPVLGPFEPLLPDAGLRRGSVVGVSGAVATSLALALLAGPSQSGAWCAAVGLPSLGLVAASELGLALERFPLVGAPPAREWPTVVGALVDAFDVVLAAPPPHLRAADVRRLTARARERSSVLVVRGPTWGEGEDMRLSIGRTEWRGLGPGHGRLRARRVEVIATGRRAAARERRAWLWLPAADGGVAACAAEG